MLKFSIRQIGKPIKQIIIDNKKKTNRLIEDLYRLGKLTHKFMIDFIAENTNTKKTIPQTNAKPLIETINYTEYRGGMGFGWAIGNIDKLKRESVHWRIINYGGKHPQAGKKVPGFFEGADTFLYAPYSGSFITIGINTIIEPMGFVEAARDYLEIRLKKIVKKYTRG